MSFFEFNRALEPLSSLIDRFVRWWILPKVHLRASAYAVFSTKAQSSAKTVRNTISHNAYFDTTPDNYSRSSQYH
jgi:hypothetical protein